MGRNKKNVPLPKEFKIGADVPHEGFTLADKCKIDPIFFAQNVLGINTHWSKQVEILRSVKENRRTTVRSGHDVGKSFVAADCALWFLYCHSPSIVLTT